MKEVKKMIAVNSKEVCVALAFFYEVAIITNLSSLIMPAKL